LVKDGKEKRIIKKKTEKKKMKNVEVHQSTFVDTEDEDRCREYLERAHNVEECETCVLIKEIHNERRKIEKINSQKSASEQIDDNPFPNVGHCGDEICFRPAYDGDRWCPKCRDFWSKFWDLSIEMTFEE